MKIKIKRTPTFSAITKVQARKLCPTQFIDQCSVGGGFSEHKFATSEPTERLNKVNAPTENRDVLHAELRERTIHIKRQLQVFRRFLGGRKSSSTSRWLVNRNINASCFGCQTRVFVPHAS